jgi:hypothetical protein
MIKRPKKDSVLVKHKKWLSDLQKTKERLEEQYLEDMRKKEEEKLRVRASINFFTFSRFVVSRS